MKAFELDEDQANAILETRLYQLARLEIEKVRKEQSEKKKRADEIRSILRNVKALWKLVADELNALAEKYGDKRRTSFGAGGELEYDAAAYVVHEDAHVVITRDGWMKRVGELKDKGATRVREGDEARWILRGNTRHLLALFSSRGVAYILKVGGIPATSGYGEPVQSMLNFKDGERIVNAVLVTERKESDDAASRRGLQQELSFSDPDGENRTVSVIESGAQEPRPVRRWLAASSLGMGLFCQPDLSETTRSGRRFARTKEGDEISIVGPAEGDVLTAISKQGKVLTFPADELPELAGAGRGVILMRLDKGDRLIGALTHGLDKPPIAVSADGSERRFQLPDVTHRAQKGRKALKRFNADALLPRP
jgi:DNA gyrase subunit A